MACFSVGFVVHAFTVYIACTMSMQYTMRLVTEPIDRAVRQRARREPPSGSVQAWESRPGGGKAP